MEIVIGCVCVKF